MFFFICLNDLSKGLHSWNPWLIKRGMKPPKISKKGGGGGIFYKNGGGEGFVKRGRFSTTGEMSDFVVLSTKMI